MFTNQTNKTCIINNHLLVSVPLLAIWDQMSMLDAALAIIPPQCGHNDPPTGRFSISHFANAPFRFHVSSEAQSQKRDEISTGKPSLALFSYAKR